MAKCVPSNQSQLDPKPDTHSTSRKEDTGGTSFPLSAARPPAQSTATILSAAGTKEFLGEVMLEGRRNGEEVGLIASRCNPILSLSVSRTVVLGDKACQNTFRKGQGTTMLQFCSLNLN